MIYPEEKHRANETVVAQLDEAINFHQSDHIADARKKLQGVLQIVMNIGDRFFSCPTEDGLRVLRRGKELFLEDNVSCSVKHGTLLLDSSNFGAQFYSSLLNVIGAFAVAISEFKMAKETFSLLVDFHQKSSVTSRRRDLGAAYNNAGCISLILGDLKQAEYDFKTSLKHLESAKECHQLHNPLLETMSIAVSSNIGRLHLLSRNYSKALEKQEQLVKTCKTKDVKELPLQVVFTVLNNLAVLYTTLGKFSQAEQELKWMVSYYYKMDREDGDFLLNFVVLHLSEVLLLHGRPKEAEKAFRLETDDIDLVEMFGGLCVNERIQTFEKLVDVFVLKGKIRFAREFLKTGVNILKNTFGPDHFNVASLLYKQGTILTLTGEVSSAAEKFNCSIEILEEIFGIKHPLLLKCYMSLGELALRSKRAEESYFYFQRAMENIEAIYQVSFVSQLSKKYLEMTSSNTFQRSEMLEDKCKIEGLVAEHGLVLAVLLSRPVVQDENLTGSRTERKQSLAAKKQELQCPYSIEVISFKYTQDFLQTGQTFLRQGMRKEADAFFQQAVKYCTASDIAQGSANARIARLYDVLTKKRRRNQETLEKRHEMTNSSEELSKVSAKISTESSSKITAEDTAMASFDNQLNLKLALIFLILLSIELKMIDTTFAAYDLYCKISQNDDGFLHFLNGGVQVYASKTSITCNGKTALQDILVSSTVGLNETDSQLPLPDEQLFRSLACKKNVPIDSFLVAYTSSVVLDVEELQALDRKISFSVQECFQEKCFETEIQDSTTQVVVDLTTTASTCDHHNVLQTGSRIELLSLCLLQGATSEIPQGENISEISTAMCQKTTRLTFKDEHTSSFMFSKNALNLLQQCNPSKILTLSVQHYCLSLTITYPVKARLTLWRKDRCINQKVQFVQTATRHGMADWTVSCQRCPGELVEDFGEAERFFWSAIDHLANAYHVAYKMDVAYSDEHPDVSDVYCEENGFLLNGRLPKRRCTHISTQKAEQSETLRNNLNASILEGLTLVSELSSQFHGDAKQEGDQDIEMDAHRAGTCRLSSSSQSQLEQEINFSDCNFQQSTLNPEAEKQSQNLEAPNLLATYEATTGTHETYPMAREEDDDNLLGRSLFEKDRNSRRSLIVELHHEMTGKSNLMNEQYSPSAEVTQQVGKTLNDPINAGTCHTTSSHHRLTCMDITNSSFEKATVNPEAELGIQNPQSHYYGNPGAKDDENTSKKHLFEKERISKGTSIAKLKNPKMEEILPKWNDRTHANEDSAQDQGFDQNQQCKSSPAPGQSARKAKNEEKQNLIDTPVYDLITKNGTENVTLDTQCQSSTLFSAHGQTQHPQDVQRQTKHTVDEEEKDETISPMEKGREYILKGRDERESNDGLNEPLANKHVSQAFSPAKMTKRETSRSSFNVYDNTISDSPVIGTSYRIHNSWIDSMSGNAYDEMDSTTNEYNNSMGNFNRVQSPIVSDGHHSSTEDSTSSLLGSLQQMMSKTVNLIVSSNSVAKQPQKEPKAVVKLSIQEEGRGSREQEQAVRIGVEGSRNQEESTKDSEETKRQPIPTPVQESPRPVCSHYQRRCLVRFPCCGKIYPCHRCHNESKVCSNDQARANNATHIRCTICYHEQVIDEQSQNCGGCKSQMSEYFCSICKRFMSDDKKPFHCDKCGTCRVDRDRSFHCDICNVCMHKRLRGKHKCRPDSGHDECCICLEDTFFSDCKILPCSHKVHEHCAIAMMQNGVRSCPICRQ